jgi:c-di-GMP-binding flagellar brake protein YcgR
MSEAPSAHGAIASQFLRARSDIQRAFVLFRDHCLPVKLQFPSADEEFAARILDVTPTRFLLEDVKPRTGLQRLRDGEPFSLAIRVDGLYARADGLQVLEVADDYGVPYCVVALPPELLYQQRRRSERFALPPAISIHDARVILHRAERVLNGRIADISAGGCRVLLDVVTDPELRSGELIERCEIDVPGQLSFTTPCAIRHQLLNKQLGRLECGIEFEQMRLADRRRLERFIQLIAKTVDPTRSASANAPSRPRRPDPTNARARPR